MERGMEKQREKERKEGRNKEKDRGGLEETEIQYIYVPRKRAALWLCHSASPDTHPETQHSTAQHCTAQHKVAQHRTAQHSTAQHSTTQHSRPRTEKRDLRARFMKRPQVMYDLKETLDVLVQRPILVINLDCGCDYLSSWCSTKSLTQQRLWYWISSLKH